jgi:hypothetical protein
MAMKHLALTDEQEAELHRLSRLYRREAERAAQGKAYLAACVMAGSALETLLVLMVAGYPEDLVAVADTLPKHKGVPKLLLKWSLAELLRVAKLAGWLPAGLRLDDDWSHRKAKIGDYAEVVRLTRNLLHPAVYIEDHHKQRVTKRYFDSVFATVVATAGHLGARVERSLLARMKAEEEAGGRSR